MKKFSIYDGLYAMMVDDARALADMSHTTVLRTQYVDRIYEDLWRWGEGIVWC